MHDTQDLGPCEVEGVQAHPMVFEVSPTPFWSETGFDFDTPQLSAQIVSLFEADTQESVWSLGMHAFRVLGFSDLIYNFSPDIQTSSSDRFENYRVLSSLDAKNLEFLVGFRDLHRHPIFQWAFRNAGVVSWNADLASLNVPDPLDFTPDSEQVFRERGLKQGVCVGFPNERTRGAAVLSLVAAPDVEPDTFEAGLSRHGDLIYALALVFHRCLNRFPYPSTTQILTQRQREVLEWVSDGKTTAEVSKIMGISTATVEKHLRLARESIGAETTAQAVSKAAFLRQIFVSGPKQKSPTSEAI